MAFVYKIGSFVLLEWISHGIFIPKGLLSAHYVNFGNVNVENWNFFCVFGLWICHSSIVKSLSSWWWCDGGPKIQIWNFCRHEFTTCLPPIFLVRECVCCRGEKAWDPNIIATYSATHLLVSRFFSPLERWNRFTQSRIAIASLVKLSTYSSTWCYEIDGW